MSAALPWEGAGRTPGHGTLVSSVTEVGESEWRPWLDRAANDGAVVGGRSRTVAGIGVAAVFALQRGLDDHASLHRVSEGLASIRPAPGSDPSGPSPMAMGAFFFDRSEPSVLVVPEHAWVRTGDGRTWRVDVHADRTPARARSLPLEPAGVPLGTSGESPRASLRQTASVSERPDPSSYADAVALVLKDIDEGLVSKVVLARALVVQLPSSPVPASILAALWATRPECSPFSVPVAGPNVMERIVGASPELVVARAGTSVTSHAFGGTASLKAGEASAVGHLLSSAKERREHRFVVEAIADALAQRCVTLDVPGAPAVVRWPSDARLGTLLQGTLSPAPDRPATSLVLLSALHPTPAVGGVGRDAALDRIRALEELPRGSWAGAIGWTDGAGDGEWVLAIRSVRLRGRSATIHAGAGVVEGSDPDEELAETTTKLGPILDVVQRGSATLG